MNSTFYIVFTWSFIVRASKAAYSYLFWALPGVPHSQAKKIAQNGSLGAFFVIVLGSAWGPRQPGSENGPEWLSGNFFVVVLGSAWGPPQPGSENGSEWLPESLFRDSFVLFLDPPQPGSENSSEWLPESLFRDSFGLCLGSPPARP